MMLLWLLNLDFSGGFAPAAPTEFIVLKAEAAVVIGCPADITVQYDPSISVPGSRDIGV